MASALALTGCGIPNTVVDKGRIRQATEAHFGNARFPIELGPVVISGDHAVADWTQGDFGGRALFERGSYGWMLVLCSGDSIRRAENLRRAGVPGFNAGWIADRLAEAEAELPPEQLSRMKRFVGTAQDHERYLKTLDGGRAPAPG